MGVDQNFYIGPYAVCRDTGVPKTKLIRFCPNNSSHRTKNKENFCSSCGSKVTEQVQTFPGELISSVYKWDVAQELDERLTPIQGMCEFGDKLTDYWTSNLTNDGVWSASLEMYTDTLLEITPEIIAESKEKFSEFFASELEKLKNHYGSVNICWGILGWCD